MKRFAVGGARVAEFPCFGDSLKEGLGCKGPALAAQQGNFGNKAQRDMGIDLNGSGFVRIRFELPGFNLVDGCVINHDVSGNYGSQFTNVAAAIDFHIDGDSAGSWEIM